MTSVKVALNPTWRWVQSTWELSTLWWINDYEWLWTTPHGGVLSIRADFRSFSSSLERDLIHLCRPWEWAAFVSTLVFKQESTHPGRSTGASSQRERRRPPTARQHTRLVRTGACCCSEPLRIEVRDVWVHLNLNKNLEKCQLKVRPAEVTTAANRLA